MYVPGSGRSEEGTESLELELLAVSHQVGARN